MLAIDGTHQAHTSTIGAVAAVLRIQVCIVYIDAVSVIAIDE